MALAVHARTLFADTTTREPTVRFCFSPERSFLPARRRRLRIKISLVDKSAADCISREQRAETRLPSGDAGAEPTAPHYSLFDSNAPVFRNLRRALQREPRSVGNEAAVIDTSGAFFNAVLLGHRLRV